MPELPDIEVYLNALRERIVDQPVEKVRLMSPFLVRSFEPPLREIEGLRVRELRRIGKRIVWGMERDIFVVIHLMVAGRLRMKERGAKLARKIGLCAFDFAERTLVLTEASKKKRASLHVVRGEEALAELDPGGIEPLGIALDAFAEALTRENHTLKRTLTDPHVFSGIGNAYSDEILHRARLSPVKWTGRLDDAQIARLHEMTQVVLREWTALLDAERKGAFPDKVTAFRKEMAVHGKYKQPCPVCQKPVQRIVRGASEVNYCPGCQTDGKLLADRALSRLLKGDWPKTLEEMEERVAKAGNKPPPKKSADKKTGAKTTKRAKPLLLLAHGAGASSKSDWMKAWTKRLGRIGKVVTFDYPYMQEGRKRPDRHEQLLAAHVVALNGARHRRRSPVVLAGKSMGGRIGCHVALTEDVSALICLGYPLASMGKRDKLRDEVLLALKTPVLFVQGTRDKLCPLDLLQDVRKRMTAPNALHVVEAGDHSLAVTKRWLKEHGQTQDDVDERVMDVIAGFVNEHVS